MASLSGKSSSSRRDLLPSTYRGFPARDNSRELCIRPPSRVDAAYFAGFYLSTSDTTERLRFLSHENPLEIVFSVLGPCLCRGVKVSYHDRSEGRVKVETGYGPVDIRPEEHRGIFEALSITTMLPVTSWQKLCKYDEHLGKQNAVWMFPHQQRLCLNEFRISVIGQTVTFRDPVEQTVAVKLGKVYGRFLSYLHN